MSAPAKICEGALLAVRLSTRYPLEIGGVLSLLLDPVALAAVEDCRRSRSGGGGRLPRKGLLDGVRRALGAGRAAKLDAERGRLPRRVSVEQRGQSGRYLRGCRVPGSNTSPRPARRRSSAPANWSVENGEARTGRPAVSASETELLPAWQTTMSQAFSTAT